MKTTETRRRKPGRKQSKNN